MPQLNFKYDMNKDAWAWVRLARKKELWGMDADLLVPQIPKDVLKEIREKSYKKALNTAIESIDKQNNKKLEKTIEKRISLLKIKWGKIDNEFICLLTNLIGKDKLNKKWTAYLTTGRMCPYNTREGWFMVSTRSGLQQSILTICHELFHFYFLYYFKDKLKNKGVKNEKIEDIKEAVTVLLNEPKFSKIIKQKDSGYPKHQEMRNKIVALRKKGTDFKNIIEDLIK